MIKRHGFELHARATGNNMGKRSRTLFFYQRGPASDLVTDRVVAALRDCRRQYRRPREYGGLRATSNLGIETAAGRKFARPSVTFRAPHLAAIHSKVIRNGRVRGLNCASQTRTMASPDISNFTKSNKDIGKKHVERFAKSLSGEIMRDYIVF